MALETKAVLSKNLLTAISTKGTAGALAFCNERAITLTDSIALNLNTGIKRVSDKNRNARLHYKRGISACVNFYDEELPKNYADKIFKPPDSSTKSSISYKGIR